MSVIEIFEGNVLLDDVNIITQVLIQVLSPLKHPLLRIIFKEQKSMN
jgi:hypothetical protein